MASMLNSSPKYDQKYVYKKSSYHYSNSDKNNGNISLDSEQNVNQLDVLLEDLKNEREQTLDKDIHSSITNYKQPIEPAGTTTRTTRVLKSHNIPLELDNSSEYKMGSRSDGLSSTYKDTLRSETSTYNSSKSVSGHINTSSNVFDGSNVSHSENNILIPALSENDTKDLTLSDNILPLPGTKVTTTVRTYTYEIPSDVNTINNKTLLYKKNIYNSSNNEYASESNLPPSVVYTSESYNTLNSPKGNNPDGTNISNRIYEINDTQEYRTQRNDHGDPIPVHPTANTIVYKVNKTEHSTSNMSGAPLLPNNTPNQILLPSRIQQSPAQPGGTTSTYYFRESTNTVNTLNGHPGDNLPPNVTIEYPLDTYGNPNPLNTVTYKYSSSTVNNSLRRPNYDGSPSAQPPPFPVDGVVYPNNTSNPPAKLNELLDSFGGDNVDSRGIDTTHRPKREVETALATSNQQIIPSVNKAGPAVYYPPGHEWLTKKEESSAAYAASGKYAKASGMYEYESGSKSKSSSKSGAAVVPVCLPLCCAMPCSIM